MQEYTIQDVLSMFLKRWWLFVISFFVCGAVALAYTVFFIPKTYQSSGMLYINSKKMSNQMYSGGADLTDMYAAERLGENFKIILKTDKFLNSVVKDTGLDISPTQLSKMISVELIENTEVITVTVTCGDPALAHTIASSVMLNAKEQISDILEVGYIKIVEDASFNPASVAPSVKKNTLVGMFLGLLIAAAWAFLKEITDTTIKSEDDIEKYFSIPIVGSIPNLEEVEGDDGYKYNYAYRRNSK